MIGTVLVGAVVAPGAAFSYDGRLSGALWPIPPTQVAHYAAVLLGCTVVLWFGGAVRGRTALLTLLGAGAALVGAHTRTALLAMVISLVVAGASMFIGHARVRRTTAVLAVLGVIAAHLLRTVDRQLVLARAISGGGGAAHRAYQGLDGNPRARSARGCRRSSGPDCPTSPSTASRLTATGSLSTWTKAGSGVVIDATLLLVLIFLAVTHRRGLRRATALFLVAYCLVASITETGLGDASPYLLELVVAASLLAAPVEEERR